MPTLLARNSAAESEGGQKFPPPDPLPFCPPERSVWRAKRAVSSVQKRFGLRQTNAPVKILAPKWRFYFFGGSGARQLLASRRESKGLSMFLRTLSEKTRKSHGYVVADSHNN